MHRALIAAATALFLSIPASALADPATITRPEVAMEHCAPQWAEYSTHFPAAWADLAPIEIDPTLPTEATVAFNKYATAVVALAEYFGAFLGLEDVDNHTLEYLEQTRARFDLAMCLFPTKADRTHIMALAQLARGETTPQDEARIRTQLFGTFDTFLCMKADEAGRQIVALDPTRPDLSQQITTILSETLVACDLNAAGTG